MADNNSIVNLVFKVAQNEQKQSLRALEDLTKKALGLEQQNLETGESAQFIAQKLQELQGKALVFEKLADEAKRVEVNSENAADALAAASRVNKGFKDAQDEVRKTRLELEQYIDSLQQAQTETVQLNRDARLDLAEQEFNILSDRVGSFGNFQSNVGAVRGIADLSGQEGVAAGIGIASELVVLGEEIPRLKASLETLPDAARAAASAIGVKGGGLVVALIALTAAIGLAAKQSKEAREEVLQYVTSQQDLNKFLADATSEDLERRIAESEAELEIARTNYEQVKGIREDTFKAIDELEKDDSGSRLSRLGNDLIGNLGSGVLEGISDVSGGLFFGTFEELEEQVDASADEVERLEGELKTLQDARAQEIVAINDTAKALNDQKNFQAQSLERNRQFAIENADLVKNATSEGLADRIDAIETERAATVELLNALFLIPEPTAEISASIDEYKARLIELNVEQQNLTYNVIPLVAAREDEAAAIEAQAEAMKDRVADLREQAAIELEFTRFNRDATSEAVAQRIQDLEDEKAALESILPELERLAPTSDEAAAALEETSDRIQAIEDDLARTRGTSIAAARLNEEQELAQDLLAIEQATAERIIAIREQTAQKEADLLRQLGESIRDAESKAAQDRADAAVDYQAKLADIEADGAREREDILEAFGRSTEQAVRDRDAVAYKNAERKRDDDLSDLEENLARQREELNRSYQQQLADIELNLERQRQSLQQRYQQQLSDLQSAQAQQIAQERANAAQAAAIRQQAYQTELAQLAVFSQGGLTHITGFAQGALAQLELFATNAMGIIASINGAAASGLGGLAGRAGGINVNVSAANARIADIVEQRMSEIFGEAGF